VAVFEDDSPAIVVNAIENGRCILFNFDAVRGSHPAVAKMLLDAVRRYSKAGQAIQLLESKETFARYERTKTYGEALDFMKGTGFQVKAVAAENADQANPDIPLLLHAVYVISDATAERLLTFARKGGTIIFSDGPTPSSKVAGLRQLLGMGPRAHYSHGIRTIRPGKPCDFITASDKLAAMTPELLSKWDQFRMDGVTALVRSVHDQAKQIKPNVWITAAVFHNMSGRMDVSQDWPAWIKEGIVDYALPMCYTPDDEKYKASMADWLRECGDYSHIVAGIGAKDDSTANAKAVLPKIELNRAAGVKGFCFFVLNKMPDALIDALAQGPFKELAKPYHPPAK
jgi:hypothetical protein